MGQFFETIPASLMPWIMAQKMLFVGSAPLSPDGHVNISPKGGPYFGIIDERTFWFMDLTGSGVETTAHMYEEGNGRIVVMFVAFEGSPRILRIWGKGTVIEAPTPEFQRFTEAHKIKPIPGSRSIITVDIHQVATSCGFSVPLYSFQGHRTTLNEFFSKKQKAYEGGKEEESMDRYWAFKSQLSIDGLPGMKRGVEVAKREGIQPLKKMVGGYEHWRVKPGGERAEKGMVLGVALLSFLIGLLVALTCFSPETVGRIQEFGKAF